MPLADTLAAVAARWAAEGIASGPAAAPEEVAAFEARHGVALPGDVRAYFLTLNGFRDARDAPLDRGTVNFWALADVRRLADEEPEVEIPGAGACFVFADEPARGTLYVVTLGPDAAQDPWVSLVDGALMAPIDPSLEAFLERYMAGAVPAVCPDPPPDTRSPARRWLDRAWFRLRMRWFSAIELRPRLRNRRTLEAELERFIVAHLGAHPELRRERTATVTLRVRIDEHGAADEVEVVHPCPHAAVNEEAARMGSRMRFRPARIGFTRVPVLVDIPLTFYLRGPWPG